MKYLYVPMATWNFIKKNNQKKAIEYLIENRVSWRVVDDLSRNIYAINERGELELL